MAFTYLKKSGNLVESATVTASSEDANFLGTNAATLPVSQPWKSVDGTTTGAKLLIDHGSAKAVDLIAVVNHNLRSGSTITVNGGTVTDPAGGDFTTTLTYRAGLAWKLLGSSESWRYWSFQLDDSGHPDNHTRMGYAMLGVGTALSKNFAREWNVAPEKVVRQVENELGTPMVGSVVAEPSLLSFSWIGLTIAQRDEVRDFLHALDLGVDPILCVPDTTDTEAYFARLIGGWSVTQLQADYALIEDVQFRTDGFGLVTA